MKTPWFFTVQPLNVSKVRPNLASTPYGSFRQARQALMECLQADARLYREWMERKHKQVQQAAYLEEPH